MSLAKLNFILSSEAIPFTGDRVDRAHGLNDEELEMRCKQSAALLLSIAILIASVVMSVIGGENSKFESARPTLASNQKCLLDSEVLAAVRNLSFGRYGDQQKAVTLLKADANQSVTCRKQVITNLLSAMDQPNLDFTAGTPQFYVWHYGTQLLGELKAVEALDILIANFDRHDGSGFPLNHYPALGGVIKMGEIALPKLGAVLRDNPDRYIRRHAVFCIAQIGGESADKILRQALHAESDPCVALCIRASLIAFDNHKRPYYIADESRTRWYTTFTCNGE